jgi:carbonic anhydrase/acetyltransferase-like protein (isoleucine patch superfamily)
VTVGHQATLHGCTIEHHCLIGMGAIVLDGAILQPYTLLAAGSLVSPAKELEGGYLWRGQPAKKIRPLTAEEEEYFDYSAAHYVQLAQKYKKALDL